MLGINFLSSLPQNLYLDENIETNIELLQQQLMEQEQKMEFIWRQKSRQTLDRHRSNMERKTQFFLTCLDFRRRYNLIVSLQNDQGRWIHQINLIGYNIFKTISHSINLRIFQFLVICSIHVSQHKKIKRCHITDV